MFTRALVITSIAPDTLPILHQYSEECGKRDIDFIVIGDNKSPEEFYIEGCNYYGISKQSELPFELAKIAPVNHYSRKNLGYLIAMKNGCDQIQETDDDNFPMPEFWEDKNSNQNTCDFKNEGWVNVYSYFNDSFIWPRGYPLEELKKVQPSINWPTENHCPIQQGLANKNPDVDAIYRLTRSLPLTFESRSKISLSKNSWSPFNSQNTYWFKEAFPLLYLPSYCSFRMTDIWRSYIAQRIAWECGWSILYHSPTVWQERNEHNLMKDFNEEIIGYQNNRKICEELGELNLNHGKENIFENMITCYEKLIDIRAVEKEEMNLLNAWINDLKKI